jgi:hypothetical protein
VSKYAWPWDRDTQSWSLEADPRYQVRDFTLAKINAGEPGYDMLIDGHVVDSAGTAESAFDQLEARYEYEAHSADLELARTRLRQARERLLERYPRAARDGVLNSVLDGLGDALGAGPELDVAAAQPGEPAERGSGFFARLLTPDLAIGVDGSQTIVLVVTEPRGKMLRVVAVTDVDAFKAALDDARTAQRIALEEADTARLRGVDEARRARGQLTQSEAVEWLTGEDEEKLSRSAAVVLVDGVRRGRAASVALAGMTYDGTYWIVPR